MPERAEAVYREDLKKYPDNGFALFGLWQSLKARQMDQKAERVWARSDVELSSSRF